MGVPLRKTGEVLTSQFSLSGASFSNSQKGSVVAGLVNEGKLDLDFNYSFDKAGNQLKK